MTIDPKSLDIPNICFSLSDADDKRDNKEFKKQRMERGFDDSETWALDMVIARFIVPRLEEYQRIAKGFLKREEALANAIDEFLYAMKIIAEDKDFSEEEEERLVKGLEQFPKIFRTLWW